MPTIAVEASRDNFRLPGHDIVVGSVGIPFGRIRGRRTQGRVLLGLNVREGVLHT